MKILRSLTLVALANFWLFGAFNAARAAEEKPGAVPVLSNVPGFAARHMSPAYWVGKSADDTLLMTPEAVKRFNRNNFEQDPYLYDLARLPDALSADDLMAKLRSVSHVPSAPRMYADCTPVTEQDFARYEASLNLANIRAKNTIAHALVVRRTPLRTYPTLDTVFNACSLNKDIDRFQESALFPGEQVAVLHTGANGNWSLVQNYNYIAWVQTKDIAIGERKEIEAYVSQDTFLMVTGDYVETVFNPDMPQVSQLRLDMGVRLPLALPDETVHSLHGQNPYVSHMVKLPVRDEAGKLRFEFALIPKVKDVHLGYLPYTEANIINQSFKFLGERYGWGHRYSGRDCTGFVSEVYKTFGILMPRNSGNQGRGPVGYNSRFDTGTKRSAKISVLSEARVGDLIYIPGHVMMVLGHEAGETWLIHDITGAGYMGADGSVKREVLNGVSITPMLPLHRSEDVSYLDLVSNIKSIRQ